MKVMYTKQRCQDNGSGNSVQGGLQKDWSQGIWGEMSRSGKAEKGWTHVRKVPKERPTGCGQERAGGVEEAPNLQARMWKMVSPRPETAMSGTPWRAGCGRVWRETQQTEIKCWTKALERHQQAQCWAPHRRTKPWGWLSHARGPRAQAGVQAIVGGGAGSRRSQGKEQRRKSLRRWWRMKTTHKKKAAGSFTKALNPKEPKSMYTEQTHWMRWLEGHGY